MEFGKLPRNHIKEQLRRNIEFYSTWKITRIGLLTVLFLLSILAVSFIYIESKSFDLVKYNQGIAEFTENENIALRVYDHLNNEELEHLPDLIEENGIPNWMRNIEIISDLNGMDYLPDELKIQNRILMDYCQLRIKAYVLIRKAIIEKSSGYDPQLKLVHMEIEKKMEEMEIQTAMDR